MDVPTIRKAMKLTLGDGYLRPFELATLRLNNMIQILGNWEALAPTDSELLVQRAASSPLTTARLAFRHARPGNFGFLPGV